MNQNNQPIKVIICVPFVRTFMILVRESQQINVIQKTFPNMNCSNKLIYWFNGLQIHPSLSFGSVGIKELSIIIVTIQTEKILFNKYFISLSKFSSRNDILNRYRRCSNYNKNDLSQRYLPKDFNSEKDKRKFDLIQEIKNFFNSFDFSNADKKLTSRINNYESINCDPFPI